MDMGQGIYTGTATLVAEELDADWTQMRVEGGAGNPKLYGNLMWGGAVQGTGGSTATASSFERYRRAGAMAHAMLVEAAAQQWNVPSGEITVANGVVSHASGPSASFGELAQLAATLPPPVNVTLKSPTDWRYIGNPKLRRLDRHAWSDGCDLFPLYECCYHVVIVLIPAQVEPSCVLLVEESGFEGGSREIAGGNSNARSD